MATNKNIKINLDYSDFSGGISDCQRKMGLLTEQFKMQQSALGNNASEVDKLAVSQSNLSSKIDLQMQIVEMASQRYKALSESEGATAAQVDNAEKAYMKQITTLNNLTNELETVNQKLDEATNAEQQMGEESNTASANTANFGSSVANTIATITSFVSAAQQAAQAVRDVATEATQWADDLQTLSSQMGVSTTTLQQFGYAANFVDVSVETMQSSMSKLTREMANAQGGSAQASKAFNDLGVSITNADGSLKSTEQVFYEVIDALGQIENVSQRDAAAMSIFGRSAQELNSLIEQGSGALRGYGDEAEQMGIVMSEDEVQALAKMQDSFDKLDQAMEASSRKIRATVAPALSSLAGVLAESDPAILGAANGFRKIMEVAGSLAPTLQAVAMMSNTAAMAKNTMAIASTTAAAAETGLGAAAMGANLAMLPELVVIGLIAIALVALAFAIKGLIDTYKEYVEAAEKATQATQSFTDAAQGVDPSAESSSSSGTKHYALGGRVSGRKVWVGEQGAELVELPSGSTVYNHQESSNMSSSNNVFNVTIDARNVDDFNKVVNVFGGLSQSMNRGNKVNG